MANKKKFSSEELINLVKGYVANTKYLNKIKYSDLVKYAEKIGYENIIYLDFSRDKKVKELINNFNEKIKLTDYNKINSSINPINLDVNYIVDNCHSDKRNQKVILNMFKDNYNSLCKELANIKDINDNLNKTIAEQEVQINKLKEQLTKEKEEKLKLKSIEYKTNLNIDRTIKALNYLIDKKCIKILSENDFEHIIKKTLKINESDLLDNVDDFYSENITSPNKNLNNKGELPQNVTKLDFNKLNPNIFD